MRSRDRNVVLVKCTVDLSVPDTASYIRGWMQMVLTPNDLFSWNNKYSKYTSYYRDYIHEYISLSAFQLCTSLTLCMLAFWSCEGVVFLVHSLSSHFTAGHVFPLPLSGANWRSLSLLWGSGPPLPKMATPSTGSAHTPSLGSNTLRCWEFGMGRGWGGDEKGEVSLRATWDHGGQGCITPKEGFQVSKRK
jgi:hypothetical protein